MSIFPSRVWTASPHLPVSTLTSVATPGRGMTLRLTMTSRTLDLVLVCKLRVTVHLNFPQPGDDDAPNIPQVPSSDTPDQANP